MIFSGKSAKGTAVFFRKNRPGAARTEGEGTAVGSLGSGGGFQTYLDPP